MLSLTHLSNCRWLPPVSKCGLCKNKSSNIWDKVHFYEDHWDIVCRYSTNIWSNQHQSYLFIHTSCLLMPSISVLLYSNKTVFLQHFIVVVGVLASAVTTCFCFHQVRLCDVIPVWAPIMMTATGKGPNPVLATLMPALWWWAKTVSPVVTV